MKRTLTFIAALVLFGASGSGNSRVQWMQLASPGSSATGFVLAVMPNGAVTPAILGSGLSLVPGSPFPTITASAATAINFADAETPSGVIDGTNATFTLAHAPNPPASLTLFRNIHQKVGVDYTLSGNTITFLAGNIPQPPDNLTACYRF